MFKFYEVQLSTIVFVVLLSCSTDPDPTDGFGTQNFGCEDPEMISYVLPYTVGDAYKLIQGNCGSFDHTGHFRYGFDFEMPIGTVVRAARTGFVNTIEERFSDDEHSIGQENRIFIQHEDDTYGRYLHFTKDGVMVEVGDLVLRGQPIGLSGNSGFSATPHLHFDVVRCLTSCNDVETIPIGFINADVPVPNEDIRYTAHPY